MSNKESQKEERFHAQTIAERLQRLKGRPFEKSEFKEAQEGKHFQRRRQKL